MNNEGILYQITTPFACYGIVVLNGLVVEAAPIAYWAVGKTWEYVSNYYKRKGYTYERSY